jgi:hypothetical protein
MRTVILALIATMAWVGVAGASAGGEPHKAGKVQLALVRSYATCGAANDTTTGNLSLPACHPSVPTDSTCAFDPLKGAGSVSASVSGTPDIKIGVKMGGLSGGCEGETLCLDADIQVTTDACTSADPLGCTSQTFDFGPILQGIPSMCCTVLLGKCQIKTTVNTGSPPLGPGTIVSGQKMSLKIGNCGVRRKTGPGAPVDTFACGIFVP